ncbi:Histone-lysine N-methyltransferase EHMT2 [Halotydeus destructor]|nr:Histone-lysine N-methyltransferase EHMT2 [Halotydeus destructor]
MPRLPSRSRTKRATEAGDSQPTENMDKNDTLPLGNGVAEELGLRGKKRSSKASNIFHTPVQSNENNPSSNKKFVVTNLPENQQILAQISGAASVLSNTSALHGVHSNGIRTYSNLVIESKMDEEAEDFSPCSCTEKPESSPDVNHSVGKPHFCQAIDAFDGKMVGCCNQAGVLSLFRASKRLPHKILCEVHLARLRRHHCCPGCGIFCSQGEFLECFAVRKQVHLFHKSCQQIVGLGPKSQHCPHCGQMSELRSVRLEMNGPVNNNVYYLTQTPVLKTPRAKMSLAKLRELPALADETNEPGVDHVINDSRKVLSLRGLPLGPSRRQLEQMLTHLNSDKASQTIKLTNKNFYTVAKNDETDKVLSLLSRGFDPNNQFEENNNETALHAASQSGHLVIVHLLIQAGANPNAQNASMETPLMQAISAKHSSVVKYLIKAGACVDIRGEDGMSAVHLAAKAGNGDAVGYMLSMTRIDVNTKDEGGWTPLVWATEHKHLNIVKMLLSKGADPSIQDDEENVGLHWAAFSGDVSISYCLIEMGCDINAANVHGDTALHIAARRDNYECVVLLLSRGADLTMLNKNNETALMVAPKSTQSHLALKVNAELKRFSHIRKISSDKFLHRDISKGKEPVQIPIVNGLDNEPVPVDYTYVSKNCETMAINIDRTITSLQSCSCEDDCTSQDSCMCSTISFRCWYDREGKLTDEFNFHDPPMIFECNRACACWKNCFNRVVQFGVRSRMQVFRAKGRQGWGVRPLRDIAKGTFVCEYVGEIISDSEADRREEDSYLFDLDNKDGETYCLDARYYGNVARFINHRCEPNLTPVKVFIDHQDLSFPRIALFANRDIKAYEELGFDYGEKFWIIKYKMFLCECAAASCKYSKDSIDHTLQVYYSNIQREQQHTTVDKKMAQ